MALQCHRVLVSSTLNTETFSTTVRALLREAFLQAPMRHTSPKSGKHQLSTLWFHLSEAWIRSGRPGFLFYFSYSPWRPTVPLLHYTKERETTTAPSSSYARQEGKGWGRIIPTTAVLKGHGDYPACWGLHKQSVAKARIKPESSKSCASALTTGLSSLPPMECLHLLRAKQRSGSTALFPSCSTSRRWELQHRQVGLKTEHLEQ